MASTGGQPATIQLRLADPDSATAEIELFYRVAAQEHPITRLPTPGPLVLAASEPGVDHSIEWFFSDEPDLPADGSYSRDVTVFAFLKNGLRVVLPGTNATTVNLGNDPPVVDQVSGPAVDGEGIVSIAFRVADTNEAVAVRIEYDVVGDDPDAGWRLCRPAGASSTPPFAFPQITALEGGTSLIFLWDTDVDLPDLDRDVHVRVTAVDQLPSESAPAVSDAFHVENNADPEVLFHQTQLLASSDRHDGIAFGLSLVYSFAPSTIPGTPGSAGSPPGSIDIADLDGDGDLDVLRRPVGSNVAPEIFVQSSPGLFSPVTRKVGGAISYPTTSQVRAVDRRWPFPEAWAGSC